MFYRYFQQQCRHQSAAAGRDVAFPEHQLRVFDVDEEGIEITHGHGRSEHPRRAALTGTSC